MDFNKAIKKYRHRTFKLNSKLNKDIQSNNDNSIDNKLLKIFSNNVNNVKSSESNKKKFVVTPISTDLYTKADFSQQ